MRDVLQPLYAEISLSVDDELLNARIKGAKSAVNGLTPTRAVGLATLAHRGQSHAATLDWLAERMERSGETLNRSHAQEIGILACAILLQSWLGEPTPGGTVGALAVQSGAFLAWKPRASGLPAAADSYLSRASVVMRRIGTVEPPEGGLTSSAEEAFPDGGAHPPEQARELHEELGALRKDFAAAVEGLSLAQLAIAEQSSILWWLFGGRLADGRRWAEAKEASRPLELARDLYELTRFVPGPRGARHFLADAMFRSEMDPQRALTIGGAMREVAEDSKLSDLVAPADSSVIVQPVLSCLSHSAYPAGARPGSLRRSALDIAVQLYRELMIGKEHRSANE